MVSKSCIKLIELAFTGKAGVMVKKVRLGEVELEIDTALISEQQVFDLFDQLGFQVVQDPEVEIVEKIKLAAIELIYYANNANSLIRNSDYISERVQLPYDKLSKIFSRVTATTLEKYIILLKVEKAKELLTNNEYTLSEISFMLGYSSVQYLSNQFKKTTGITVSEFKEAPQKYRRSLEDLLY
jgi:AraC-like DNA-binding protein